MQYLEIIYKAKANKNSSRAAVKRLPRLATREEVMLPIASTKDTN
jgi:hypothetical protein